jgi:hypothetical protein
MLAVAAPVAAKNPPGNNGTIKIDRLAFDDHPNNEPHVGCTFQVDFYGFDEGVGNAHVIFELHPPTADGRTMTVTSGDLSPDIGEDDNSGGGSEAGLDASETYTLAFTGAPHPQQGYHVKLTIHAPGSQGADVKHKVFWVTGCNPPSNPQSNPPSNPPSNTPSNPPSIPPSGDVGGGSGAVRVNTKGSSGGPAVAALPNTAMDPSTGSLLLVLGVMLVGATATLVTATVRSNDRRRR